MKSFRFTSILLIILAAVGIAYAVCPAYIRRAVMHQRPGVSDYKLFDNRIVAAGNYQPWTQREGFDKREIPGAYTKTFRKFKTLAFLVIKNEEVIFEKYWDGYSSDTRSNSFSMAASVLGLLVGIAMDEGWIKGIDQPVGDFLPDFKTGPKKNITVRHLMEMSSGLSWDEASSGLFATGTKAYYGNNLTELALNQEVIKEPGKLFEYKGGNTVLLALVLEKATGRKVGTYASEKLWKPLGAKNDAWWSLDNPDGIEKAFCCYNSDARDFARLGQLILFRGNWYGQQLVSGAFLNQALLPAAHLRDENGKPVDYFGWHWWLARYRGYDIYYMRGTNGQYVIAIPEMKTVIVRLGRFQSSELIKGIPSDFFAWVDAGLELAK